MHGGCEDHERHEDFGGELQEVGLGEGGSGNDGRAGLFALGFKGAPFVFHGYERDVVDEEEIEETEKKLGAVGDGKGDELAADFVGWEGGQCGAGRETSPGTEVLFEGLGE